MSTYRDQIARHACRVLGEQLNSYVTGDPGSDDVAEYLAGGWLIADDYYAEDDAPVAPDVIAGQLARSLHQQAQALARLANDLTAGTITLDSLRRLDLPRRPPALDVGQ